MTHPCPTIDQDQLVWADGQDVLRVGDVGVPLDSVLVACQQGYSPEDICVQYPMLRVDEVHGAIAYAQQHRDEMDRYLRRQDAVWEYWRNKAATTPSAVVERLQAQREAMLPR